MLPRREPATRRQRDVFWVTACEFQGVFGYERDWMGWHFSCLLEGMSNLRYPIEDRRSILINAAAAVLGVSRRTVYYHIQAGRLQTIRTRGGSQRVLWSSIESWLRAAGEEGAPQGG